MRRSALTALACLLSSSSALADPPPPPPSASAAPPPPATATLQVTNLASASASFVVRVGGVTLPERFTTRGSQTLSFSIPAGVGDWKALGEQVVDAEPEVFGLRPGGVLRITCSAVSNLMTLCDLQRPSSPEAEVATFLSTLNLALRKRTESGLTFVLKLPLSVYTGGERGRDLKVTSGAEAVKVADLLALDPVFVTAAQLDPSAVGPGEAECGRQPPSVDWAKGGRSIVRTGDSARVTVTREPCTQYAHRVVYSLKKSKGTWQLVGHSRAAD